MTSAAAHVCVDQQLFDRQVELEEESIGLGIKRYQRNREKGGESDTHVGTRVMSGAIEDVATHDTGANVCV
jgi:DNA-directed RNA polymerase